jgi:hypothetical protein
MSALPLNADINVPLTVASWQRSHQIAERWPICRSEPSKKQLTRIHSAQRRSSVLEVKRRFCPSVAAKRPQKSRFLVPFTPRPKPPKMAGVGDSSG